VQHQSVERGAEQQRHRVRVLDARRAQPVGDPRPEVRDQRRQSLPQLRQPVRGEEGPSRSASADSARTRAANRSEAVESRPDTDEKW
jgi:hypothetical protein